MYTILEEPEVVDNKNQTSFDKTQIEIGVYA